MKQPMRQAELGTATADGQRQLQRLLELPTLREHSERYMRRVIALCEGDLTLAAKVLKIGRATMYRQVKRMDLDKRSDRTKAQQRLRAIKEEFATRGARL